MEEYANKSYISHTKHIEECFVDKKEKYVDLLTNKDNLFYILSNQILQNLSPFFRTNNTWLTVGDFFGFEAKYLSEKNQHAVASDLDITLLEYLRGLELIKECKKENVESISLPDNSFDYVFCKEAFHHFPKAYKGVYEMIRVAKQGAILIEPVDILTQMPLVLFLKNICDIFNPMLINKIWKNRFSFETVGNYVFKLSEREIEKIAMGMGLPYIAFKKINVYLTTEEQSTESPVNKKVFSKIKRSICIKNVLSKLRIIPYNTLCAVVFKEEPNEKALSDMKKLGYTVIKLPENPYLKAV